MWVPHFACLSTSSRSWASRRTHGLRPLYIYHKRRMALSPSKGHFEYSSQLPILCTYKETMTAWLYILRLKSGQLSIGSTTDLTSRVEEHYSGQACRTTKLDPPVKVVYSESLPTFSDARKREAQIKRWNVGAVLKKKRSWLVTWLSCGIFLNPEIKRGSNLLQRCNEIREIH